MRIVKKFEEYLEEGIVRKSFIDKERSRSLVIEAERKNNSLKENIEKIGPKDENANDYA